MAKPDDIISFNGKLGNQIFTSRKGTKYVKSKSAKPIAQTAAMKANAANFGAISKLASRLHQSYAAIIAGYANGNLIALFQKRLMAVLKSAESSKKDFAEGNVELLTGLQLNIKTPLSSLLHEMPTVWFIEKNKVIVRFAEGDLLRVISWPAQALKAVLQLQIVVSDLEYANDHIFAAKNLVIVKDSTSFAAASLTIPVQFNGLQLVTVMVAIHFLRGNDDMASNQKQKAAGLTHAILLRDGEEINYQKPTVEKPNKPVEFGDLDWD